MMNKFTNNNTQKVYDVIKTMGPVTRPVIVKVTKMKRSTVYDAILRLKWQLKDDEQLTYWDKKPPTGEGRKGSRPKRFWEILIYDKH